MSEPVEPGGASPSLGADRTAPARHGQPQAHAGAVSEADVDAALAASDEWVRRSRSVVFTSPARDQVRAMLEAATWGVAAAERDRVVRDLRRRADRAVPGVERDAWIAAVAVAAGTEPG